ncbi:hypothetical protein BTJ39_24055 [Izhakiella australiensis]|uniref:Uncharacterized protein n=1 Tax=Izhakiella australiensis TaxID=1926881 RepID=A0A1S8Y4E7_9GAMM|nr:hypothetical protein [Izhakiella australiensis]OON33543.1 hypothetical protein BTJ39_24055 [Izhakiella australiensis]
MDIISLVSTFSSVGTRAKAFIEERDRQKLSTLQIDLSKSIIEAQTQLLEILSAVTEKERRIYVLEQRIRELEAEQAEKARYRPTKLGTVGQFFAYTLSDAAKSLESIDESEYFLCQSCFDGGKKVVLIGNGEGGWRCPVCKISARVTPDTFNVDISDDGCW